MGMKNRIFPDNVYFLTMTVVDWVDVFTRPAYRHIIVDALRYSQQHKGLELYAWCLMNQFYIAEYLIYCDMWTMEIELNQPSRYKIMGGTDGSAPTVLTHSFTEFLTRFLIGGVFDDGGLYKWREETL